MRVLVAEDHDQPARAVAAGLRRYGMTVDVALDGNAALERLAVSRYDVVVLDRDLPGTHGDDICRDLAAGRSESRVLMLTAASSVKERVDGLGLGADDYLPKPFDFTELVARVQALGRRPGAPQRPGLAYRDVALNPEKRVATRALDELFDRLNAAFDAQQHFAANASHELRTPLTAERTLLQVALDDPYTTSKEWRSTAQEVLASNREQETLIEALLALASSEGGLGHRERIDLPETCRQVLARPSPRTGPAGLHIQTRLGPAVLDGDPRLIERLVTNLVDNAVGHNVAGGHVWVFTAVTAGRAVLTVTNTGQVIPGGEVGRLFQPFQRLNPGRTHHKAGHGLGLSIVRAIATAHGAAITARPRPGGGLAVAVAFPPPALVSPPQARVPGAARAAVV